MNPKAKRKLASALWRFRHRANPQAKCSFSPTEISPSSLTPPREAASIWPCDRLGQDLLRCQPASSASPTRRLSALAKSSLVTIDAMNRSVRAENRFVGQAVPADPGATHAATREQTRSTRRSRRSMTAPMSGRRSAAGPAAATGRQNTSCSFPYASQCQDWEAADRFLSPASPPIVMHIFGDRASNAL